MYKPYILLPFIFMQLIRFCYSQEFNSFEGMISGDNVNCRSDSTVNSEIICTFNEGDYVEVVSQIYDWYKIKLPKTAPSFIKKKFTAFIGEKNAKVTKDNVNIRLRADETSPILGRLGENEIINILEDHGEWCRIEPTNNSFGWTHKKFVKEADKKKIKLMQKAKEDKNTLIDKIAPLDKIITAQGVIKPKTIHNIATHKFISEDKKIFLLKGDKEGLDAFNSQRVRITARLTDAAGQKLPVVEIIEIEAID